jgi:hypothetical protein
MLARLLGVAQLCASHPRSMLRLTAAATAAATAATTAARLNAGQPTQDRRHRRISEEGKLLPA